MERPQAELGVSPQVRPPATPEEELAKIRAKLKANAERIAELEKRRHELGDDLAKWQRADARVEALAKHGVEKPWLVVTEAERAEASVGGLEAPFVLVSLAMLRHETGIPQQAIFGHDHPDPGNAPPYFGHRVTHERGKAFLRALHRDVWAYMNGVHWTQTTWYEKVFRVATLSPDLTDPGAHLRVCLGDLAVLIHDRGLHGGVAAYNGAGPAAVAYADAVLGPELDAVRSWLPEH